MSIYLRVGVFLGRLFVTSPMRCTRGATMLEYGLLVALIAIGLIAVLRSFDLAGQLYEPVAAIFRGAAGGDG
ncbi:MAG: Flp family type IVb pilin [Alphaproteobacteria bacterium]|nr:Flp family type IVb pilin [Alphaproteobacteria bacterium]